MKITIHYASRRVEIWRWYWRAWRRSLWRIHLLVFLLTASLLVYSSVPVTLLEGVAVMSTSLLPLAALVILPMLRFKSQTRVLSVDDQGIQTTIGKINGSFTWDEVKGVYDEIGDLIIERINLNAFIIPPRAFETAEDRERFKVFVAGKIRNGG